VQVLENTRNAIVRFNKMNPNARIRHSHLVSSVKARQKRISQARMGVYLPSKRQDAMDAGWVMEWSDGRFRRQTRWAQTVI